MVDERALGEHLLACFDAIYRVLGESAPKLGEDAYVVRVHEMSRAFGTLALEVRELLDVDGAGEFAVLEGVLRHAADSDESGAMVLYAMSVVVGPRLLVTLLDARRALGPCALTDLCDRASQVVVAQIRATGDVALGRSAIDDPAWRDEARILVSRLESAGNVESLGLSR